MTIRLRLTLWYTALLGTTLILFSVTVYSVLAANLRAQLEQSAAVQARTIADAVTQQFQLNLLIVRNEPDALVFPEVELFASSVGVQIVNLDGRILTRSQNLGDIELPNYQQALHDGRRRCRTPLLRIHRRRQRIPGLQRAPQGQ